MIGCARHRRLRRPALRQRRLADPRRGHRGCASSGWFGARLTGRLAEKRSAGRSASPSWRSRSRSSPRSCSASSVGRRGPWGTARTSADGDDGRSACFARRHRRVAPPALRGATRAPGRALLDDLGARGRSALHGGLGRDRRGARPRLPRRLSVHARRLSVDVPRELWTMRQFAGFGTAEETNERFRYLLDHGQTGLDGVRHALADGLRLRPPALARRGRAEGVAIDSLEDMETPFAASRSARSPPR